MDIVIPSLGDIDEVEVIELCVNPGDELAENDAILVIESDKASMEVPTPVAGVLQSLSVKVGDMVGEGTVVGVIDAVAAKNDQAPTVYETETSSAPDKPSSAEPQTSANESDESAQVVRELDILVPDIGDAADVVVIEIAVKAGDEIAVGDLLVVLESDKASMEIAAEHAGVLTQVVVTQDQEVSEGSLIASMTITEVASTGGTGETAAPLDAVPKTQSAPRKPSVETEVKQKPSIDSGSGDASAEVVAASKVYAGPAVRRLARELGVELQGVVGTGNRGRITKDDVKLYVKGQLQKESGGAGQGSAWPTVAKVDFAKFGVVEKVELSRIRQRGAENLHRSWVNLPHVTQHDEVDISDLESFRASLKPEAQERGVKVTPLAFLIKACAHGLRTFPEFNASLDADGKHLILKQYINIGVAVDTPEGLVVPVVKDAASKNIWQISADIAQLSAKARDRKLSIDDLQGGSFSISSLGALGGTGFTPIVNAPEVAILGVAKLQTKPVWDGSVFQPRKVLPLSLSYDHRVINGADGGRFMQYLISVLGDIRRLAL